MKTPKLLIFLILILSIPQLNAQDLIERTQNGISPISNTSSGPNRLYNEISNSRNFNNPSEYKMFQFDANAANSSDFKTNLLKAPVFLNLDKQVIKSITALTSEEVIQIVIPVDDKSTFRLKLREYNCLSDGFVAITDTEEYIDHSHIKTFRGVLAHDPKSLVSLTISDTDIRILISDYSGNYSLGKYGDKPWRYVLLNDSSKIAKQDFKCGVDGDYQTAQAEEKIIKKSNAAVGCVDIYIEVDHDLYLSEGTVEKTLFNSISLFNEVAIIFSNENVDINISDLKIWTTADPYPDSESNLALNAFINQVGTSFNGDLAHLIASDANNGGLAELSFLGQLENKGRAYSDILSFSFGTFPSYSWQVNVISHELGHNFGSPHTHSCWWSGGAIDNCFCPEGSCGFGPEPSSSGGTIMSYCYLPMSSTFANCNIPTSNPETTDFTLGFGTLPGNTIRSAVSNAISSNTINGTCSCSVPCAQDLVLDDFGSVYPRGWGIQQPRMFGDVNGDGLEDIIGFANAGVELALSTGTDVTKDPSWNLADFGLTSGGWNVNSHPRHIIDVNGDGNDDIVGFAAAGVYVSLSTGSNFQAKTEWISGFGINNGWTIQDLPRVFGDFNNDGMNDFIGFANSVTAVGISTGTSFVRNVDLDMIAFHGNGGWSGLFPRMVGDVDGDGFDDDVVGFGNSNVLVAISDGTTFGPVTSWSTNFTTVEGWSTAIHLRFLADVNGDGKDDIVGFANEGVRVGISNGTSFEPEELWIGTFGINAGWTLPNYPRHMVDINGDGLDDIIGFGNAGVFASLSNGTSFDASMQINTCFGAFDNWTSPSYVRSFADFNGDDIPEIVAMGCGGTYIDFPFVPPVYTFDDCEGAIPLTVSSSCTPNTFNNEGLTPSGQQPPFVCGTPGATIDAWFSAIVPPSGNLTIETTQVPSGLSDMIMQVLVGTCGTFTTVFCDDDSGSGTHSLYTITNRTPGEIIYVRVIEFFSNAFGDFGICAYDESAGCPPDYGGTNSLTGTQSVSIDFETNGIIESDQIISADVDYSSGTSIKLLQNFEVQSGTFHAYIEGCTD